VCKTSITQDGSRDLKDIIDTVHVLAKPNPFKQEVLETYIGPGMSIRDILGNDSDSYLVCLDGEMIPSDQWALTFPAADSHVVITRLPQGDYGKDILRIVAFVAVLYFAWWAAPSFAGWFGGSVAFWQSALSFAGVLLVGLLLPPTLPSVDNTERRRLNALTGTRNQFAPFSPIPIVYGTHRLYPPYASVPYTEIIGEDQYLNCIFCVGLGEYEIDGADIKIGETVVTDYEDIEVLQTDQPTQPDIFEEQLSLTLDQDAEPGDSQTRTTQSSTSIVGLDFVLPSGLIQIDPDDGDKHYVRIHLLIEYRISGSSDPWVSMTSTDWGNTTRGDQQIRTDDSAGIQQVLAARLASTIISASYGSVEVSNLNSSWVQISARTRDPLRVGVKFPAGSSNTWDVRVTRMRTQLDSRGTLDSTNDTWDQYAATLVWTSLKSINPDQTAVALPANTATFLVVRIRATDQLTGTIDSLNVIAKRRLRSWNKVGQTFNSVASTRNPAWAFLDVLTGLGNARPIASGDEANKILLDDLADWATYCANESFFYDEVIDYSTSVFEALSKIASVGRASLTNRDGKWGIIQEKLEGTAVQYFTPRNSWGFSVTKRFVDFPHALKVRFISEDDGYQEVERYVYDDGYNVGNATKFEVLQLSGITDPDQAWRVGRYTIASTKLRPEIFTFNTDVEHLICQRGDHILVAHDIPLWGTVYGRITDISGNQVTLDEAAVLDGGTSYRMRVRLNDGTSVIEDLTSQGGETFTHTFTPSIPAGISVGDLAMVGELSLEAQELVVIAVEPGSDLSARITCVEANDAIINADTGTIPAYTPSITLPADITTVRPAPPYDLQTNSGQLTQNVDGASVLRPRIVVTWSLVGDADQRWPALNGQIRYREYDATFKGGTWTYISTFNAFAAYAEITAVDIGLQYEIQMRTISPWDKSSPWSTAVIHTVSDQTISPLVPTNLTATAVRGGALLSWSNPVYTVFDFVQIWVSNTNVRSNAAVIGTTRDDVFYDNVSEPDRARYYWVRVVDKYGQFSEYEPSTTTTTAVAFPLIEQRPIVADPFIRQGPSFWSLSTGSSYVAGAGTDGTDVIQVNTTSFGTGFTTAARRGPNDWDTLAFDNMTVEVRMRVRLVNAGAGEFWSQAPIVRILVEDEGGGNPTYYGVAGNRGGRIFSNTDTLNVWYDTTYIIEIDAEENETPPRFMRVDVLFGVNLIGPVFQIDFMEATVSPGLFKPNDASQPKMTGLVPPSPNNAVDFLRADGTWATPPGGSASNSFETQTVTDTDSGYSWSATGSAVASVATDTLTWVSGQDIDIDVDPASQAIRISASFSAGVTLFNGRSGAVTPEQADYDSFFLTPAEGNAAYLPIADHPHSTFDRASSVLSGATVFSNIVVTDGITTAIATRNLTAADVGALGVNATADNSLALGGVAASGWLRSNVSDDFAGATLTFTAAGEGLEIEDGGSRVGNATLGGHTPNDTRRINLRDGNPPADGALLITADLSAASDAGSELVYIDRTNFEWLGSQVVTEATLGSNAVTSFNSRQGPVTPQQSDYDSFFLTPAEADAAYLGINATADNSLALGGVSASGFLRSNLADNVDGVLTFNARPNFNGGTGGSSSPFTVDSTFVVTNLNADLLDGVHASGFFQSTSNNIVSGAGLITMYDNRSIRFGTGADVSMFFDGVDDFFVSMANGVDFRVRGGASGAEPMITALDDNAVVLYFNGVQAFTTSAYATTGNTSSARVRDHLNNDYDVGFNVSPSVALTADLTLDDQHVGKTLYKTSTTAGIDIILPTGSQFPVGSMVNFVNAGNSTVNISRNTNALYWLDGSTLVGGTANRTVAYGAVITIWRQLSGVYYMWGNGIS